MTNRSKYLGIDVGTSSVRAALVDEKGNILGSCVKNIKIWNYNTDFYEQSSENIWSNIVKATNEVMAQCKVDKIEVKGIGFDATCSLVVLDSEYKPVTVSLDGDEHQNVVLWMDHRAHTEAEFINTTNHKVLDSVGGVMSVEMQPPKLMWIKKNLPKTWEKAAHLFDLPDFLTWQATGSLNRSMCSLVCKWGYQADAEGHMGWDDDFLTTIGLEDLREHTYRKLGNQVFAAGHPCGQGLSEKAAKELDLCPGTPVGTSLIDAHAGALGCLGCSTLKTGLPDIGERLVVIAGTSTCHIICSPPKVSVPGVWGPYFSAVVPGLWVNEGGQSATGKLIDFIIETHPAYSSVQQKAKEKGCHTTDYLNNILESLKDQKKLCNMALLTKDIHIWPDFHGNRSPVADATLKGMVCGLNLSASEEDLAILYLATMQSLAYGTRHIMSEMRQSGHRVSLVYLCGGLGKNNLYVQIHADVLGLPVILPACEESVLLGAAMLGACASGEVGGLQSVMAAMGGEGEETFPDAAVDKYHSRKYEVFLEMLKDQRKYRKIMKDS